MNSTQNNHRIEFTTFEKQHTEGHIYEMLPEISSKARAKPNQAMVLQASMESVTDSFNKLMIPRDSTTHNFRSRESQRFASWHLCRQWPLHHHLCLHLCNWHLPKSQPLMLNKVAPTQPPASMQQGALVAQAASV